MNKVLSVALTAVGGVAFFGVSFVGFARLAGVPLHQIAVVGPILIPLLGVEAPPETTDDAVAAPPSMEFGSAQEVVRASVGALGAFTLPVPFDRDELQRLSDELEARRAQLDERLESVAVREQELVDQLARLEHMSADLAKLRTDIDAREAALELRAQEVARDEEAEAQAEKAQWTKLGRLLVGLEPRDASQRLLQHPPEEAAKILSTLTSAQASSILAGVPKESWGAYSRAYAELAD